MAEFGIFGNLYFEEQEHGWALDAGEDAARLLYCSSMPRTNEPQQTIDNAARRLQALLWHKLGITITIPSPEQRRGNKAFENAKQICEKATDGILARGVAMAYHFAFWHIGLASRMICLLAASRNTSRGHLDFEDMIREGLESVNAHFRYLDIKPQPMLDEMGRYAQVHGTFETDVRVRDLMSTLNQPFVILGVSADPLNAGFLGAKRIAEKMSEYVASAYHRYRPVCVPYCRPDQLAPLMAQYHPAVIHFSGHGGDKFLCFEEYSGFSHRVTAAKLAATLRGADRRGLRVVILSACYSASTARELANDLGCLIVASENCLTVGDAWNFTFNFYTALASGKSPVQAYMDIEEAMNKAGTNTFGLCAYEGGP